MLGNFQGQPLTPIERGLDRASSGFGVLLNTIQGVANRVVENKRLAEQRDWVERREKTQYDREIEKINLQTQLQHEKELDILERRGEQQSALNIQEFRLRQTEEIRKLQIQAGPLGQAATRAQSLAQTQGRVEGEAPIRAEQRRNTIFGNIDDFNQSLLKLVEKNPLLAQYQINASADPDTGIIMATYYDPSQNEWVQGSISDVNNLVARTSAIKSTAETLLNTYNTDDYTPETRRNAAALANSIMTGSYTDPQSLDIALSNFQGTARLTTVDTAKQRETTNAGIGAASFALGQLSNINSPNAPAWTSVLRDPKKLPNLPTTKENLEMDIRQGQIASILNSKATPGVIQQRIAQYIQTNYSNVTTLANALAGSDYIKPDESSYDEQAAKLYKILSETIPTVGSSSGRAGDQLFLNPFAQTNDADIIATPTTIAGSIINMFGRTQAPTSQPQRNLQSASQEVNNFR